MFKVQTSGGKVCEGGRIVLFLSFLSPPLYCVSLSLSLSVPIFQFEFRLSYVRPSHSLDIPLRRGRWPLQVCPLCSLCLCVCLSACSFVCPSILIRSDADAHSYRYRAWRAGRTQVRINEARNRFLQYFQANPTMSWSTHLKHITLHLLCC